MKVNLVVRSDGGGGATLRQTNLIIRLAEVTQSSRTALVPLMRDACGVRGEALGSPYVSLLFVGKIG